jgi:hypothetical protein
MKEYFQSQLEKTAKPDFKLFYFIQSGGFPEDMILQMKSIDSTEINTFDFSNLEFLRTGTSLNGIFIPVFQYKNT